MKNIVMNRRNIKDNHALNCLNHIISRSFSKLKDALNVGKVKPTTDPTNKSEASTSLLKYLATRRLNPDVRNIHDGAGDLIIEKIEAADRAVQDNIVKAIQTANIAKRVLTDAEDAVLESLDDIIDKEIQERVTRYKLSSNQRKSKSKAEVVTSEPPMVDINALRQPLDSGVVIDEGIDIIDDGRSDIHQETYQDTDTIVIDK